MRIIKILVGFVVLVSLLSSCNKDFSVNADWTDITIVYGLLSQNDSVHNLRITKAYLGPGNALSYAKIADSSNYLDGELNVRLDEYDNSTGSVLRSIPFTYTIDTTKEAGDSIFYFPDQVVYRSTATLNQKYTYKLIIHNNKTGKEITSQTSLVNSFPVTTPDRFSRPTFITGENSQVEWTSAVGGRRYQLNIRFHYTEKPLDGTTFTPKYIDWLVFTNVQSINTLGGQVMIKYVAGSAFYSILQAKIPVNPNLKRYAGLIDYIFSVASDDMATYMEVTEPSTSVVQYRPPYTNITNGIGLFSSRFVNAVDSLRLGEGMVDSIRANPKTADLGF
jgi:hypothetical protein